MVLLARGGLLLFCLVLAATGCRGSPPPAPTPLPSPTAAVAESREPQSRPWPEGVLFYEVDEPEQTCLGYQEYASFRDTVTQIKIVCTLSGVETVYFIDTEKQTVVVVRMPIPVTVKPQE